MASASFEYLFVCRYFVGVRLLVLCLFLFVCVVVIWMCFCGFVLFLAIIKNKQTNKVRFCIKYRDSVLCFVW